MDYPPEIEYSENVYKGTEIKCYCNRCKNVIKHTVLLDLCENGSEIGDCNDGLIGYQIEWKDDYQVIKCNGCDTISFRKYGWFSEYQDEVSDGHYTENYPESEQDKKMVTKLKHLPNLIEDLYTETINAYNNKSFLLCAIGLRTLIESVCKDKGILSGKVNDGKGNYKESRNLDGMINGLCEADIITRKQSNILHDLRLIGNDAAHEFQSPSIHILDAAYRIIDLLLNVIYELPKEEDILKE
jgi:hypothetical protein